MHRRTFLMTLSAPLLLAQQDSDPPPPIFRMDVSLVSVDAKVTRRDGTDIGNLQPTDFILFDEGQPQTLTHFGKQTTPIDLLLVLDVSRNMRPLLRDLTPQVSDALRPLRPGDRAGVLLFAQSSNVVQPLTTDLIQVPRATVNSIYKADFGRTPLLNQALIDATRYLKSVPATGRRTIIVITNNEGIEGAVHNYQVLPALYKVDATTNFILAGTDDLSTHPVGYRVSPENKPDVFEYARKTGGEVVTGEDPAKALHRVIQETTTRYSLQFAPSGGEPGAMRSLRVQLSPVAAARYPGARIQARSGYQVPK